MLHFFTRKRPKDRTKKPETLIKERWKHRPIKDALMHIFGTTTACCVMFGYAVYAGYVIVPIRTNAYAASLDTQPEKPVAEKPVAQDEPIAGVFSGYTQGDMQQAAQLAEASTKEVTLTRQ